MKKAILVLSAFVLTSCSGGPVNISNQNIPSTQPNIELNRPKILESARKRLVKECKDSLNYYYNATSKISADPILLKKLDWPSKSVAMEIVGNDVFYRMIYFMANKISPEDQKVACEKDMAQREESLIQVGLITEKNRQKMTKELKRNTLKL